MELGENLDFDSTRGLYFVSETQKTCIASADGFITPLFVIALQGKLSELSEQIMHTKEWQRIPVNTTFISYVQLCHYVALSEHEAVNKAMPKGQREALDKLTRAYLNWVIECEDKIVAEKPSVWFEPAFYPAGVTDPTGGDDIYNQYDAIPFGGFARTAFYFFISNTAKDAIRTVLQSDDLLASAKTAIEKCKNIFADKDNVILNPGMFRRLLETYLDWRYKRTETALAHDITLVDDDLWQHIFDEESRAYKSFNDNMDRCRLYGLRPLLTLQNDFLKRMQKDHPYITGTGKRINPNNLPPEGDYKALALWLKSEMKNGQDYLADVGGKVTKLCEDIHFKRRIAWKYIEADSLRHAIRALKGSK